MSYFLADSTGPLDDFASIGGLSDFRKWALKQQDGRIRSFARQGFTEDPEHLAEALLEVTAPGAVQEQRDLLIRHGMRAKDILIITDGTSGLEEFKTLGSKKLFLTQEALLHLADTHTDIVRAAIKFAFAKGRSAVRNTTTSKAAEAGAKAVYKALMDTLPDTLLVPLGVAGQAGLHLLHNLRTAQDFRAAAPKETLQGLFDVSNPNAIKWAREHAAEQAKNISETTRQEIAAAVARAVESGDLRELHDDIEAAVGDDDRADLIARTEVMYAVNEGNRESWNQAVDQGLLTGDEQRVWIATQDACPECEALDGELADLDGEYPDDGGDGPPLHPRCRCTEGLTV